MANFGLNIEIYKMSVLDFEDDYEAEHGEEKREEMHQSILAATMSCCTRTKLYETENAINVLSISVDTDLFQTHNLNTWEEISPKDLGKKILKWAKASFGSQFIGQNIFYMETVNSYHTVTYKIYFIPVVNERIEGRGYTYISDEAFWKQHFGHDCDYKVYYDFFINVVLRYNLHLEYGNRYPCTLFGQDVKELMDMVQKMVYRVHRDFHSEGIGEYFD